MRNPIRLKNLNARFLPLYVFGVAILVIHAPRVENGFVALPLILLGLALRSWGAGHLVKNHVLTTTGPYSHLRHPLYLGTILIASGFAVWLGGWLALVLLALVWPWFALQYFPRKERSESARLEGTYGERFVRYRAAVPALWPRIRAWREDATSGVEASFGGWTLDRYSDNNELGTLLAVSFGALVFWLRSVGDVG
jgi:protein-S-isoprenylcysteine O-methyltransferase Ste14